MTDYRAVVRHVRYWRGAIHRWSTSYEFTGSGPTPGAAAAQILLTADDKMCYSAASPVTGGTYQCEIYLASGGTPVGNYVAFPYATYASWIPHAATGWPGAHTGTAEPVAEVALLVEWAGGLSSSGKPVKFKKWYHAVPESSPAAAGAVDVNPAAVTSLQAQALALQTCLSPTYGLVLGNSRRLAGTSPVVLPYYGNHQMPRGRRKRALVTGSGVYTGPRITVPEIPVAD